MTGFVPANCRCFPGFSTVVGQIMHWTQALTEVRSVSRRSVVIYGCVQSASGLLRSEDLFMFTEFILGLWIVDLYVKGAILEVEDKFVYVIKAVEFAFDIVGYIGHGILQISNLF